MRLTSMRQLYVCLIAGAVLVAAGCARGIERTPAVPPPSSAPAAYEPGAPVTNKLEAELAGRQLFERPGQRWLGIPRLVLAEEMTYEQALDRIGLGDGQYDTWPAQTRVWLTIFQGTWQLMPIMPPGTPAAPMPYQGCVLLVFTAADGGFISMGDSVCP